MRRIAIVLMLLIAGPGAACTFCAGSTTARPSLREHFQKATFVARGKLKNPKFDPTSTTEFHVELVLKSDPALAKPGLVMVPRYLPVVGDTPPDFILFGVMTDGKFDPLHAVPAGSAVGEYLTAAAKVDAKDPVARLGFAFRHLDSVDPSIATDAFLEFAKASDADIVAAKAILDPAKVAKWLADPRTSPDRLGVYAMLLGLAGKPADVAIITGLLNEQPTPPRVTENLGGLLAGLIFLDPAIGWARAEAVLTDPARPVDQRLAVIGTIRFFQANRPDEKPRILRCYRGLLPLGDLSDLAVDDLRRWGWWDLTPDVLGLYGKPTHASKIVVRGLVRYALRCPADEAKQFVTKVRTADPKLVEDVEETLKLFDPIK